MAERVLIQCGDHWENQCRVLPLALAYRERGWEPVVLTYDPWQGALFVAHGVMVCPLVLSRRRPVSVHGPVDMFCAQLWRWWPSATGRAFRQVLDVECQRSPGRFASRRKRRKVYHSVVRHRAVLARLIDEIRPARVAVWNGLTGVVANWLRLMAAERGLATDFLERGLLPQSVFIDPCGTNGDSSLHLRKDLPDRSADGSRLPVLEPSGANPLALRFAQDARVLFLPLQVQADTNLLFHNDRIESMRHLVETVSAAAPPDMLVVARPHPEETNRDLQLPSLPNVRYVSEGAVEQWCDAAAVVVTVNSTVGLTALLRGRPVVALGRGIYTNKGLTTDVAPDQDLAEVLTDPKTYVAPAMDVVERYYQLLLDRHTVFADGRNLGVARAPKEASPKGLRPRRDLVGSIEIESDSARSAADCWGHAQAAACEAAGRASVLVVARIQRRHTRNLTYRRTNEEVTRDALISGVASMLQTDRARVSLLKGGGPPIDWRGVCVVVQPQDFAEVPKGADLVVDQYLQPSVRWLAERVAYGGVEARANTGDEPAFSVPKA